MVSSSGRSSCTSSRRVVLHGYDILSEVSLRSGTYVYKTRLKLHEDVPQYMDAEEPCFALKCIDLSQHDLPAEGKQRAVREMQALLKLHALPPSFPLAP